MKLPFCPHLLQKDWFTIALPAILMMILIVTAVPTRTPVDPGIAARLLVAGFVNDTNTPELGRNLDHVLKLTLQRSPVLALYPQREIEDSLRQMFLNPSAPLTVDVVQHICITDRIPAFLLPRVLHSSGTYVLSLTLVSVKNGIATKSLLDTVRCQNESELFPGVEAIGRRVRQVLGEPPESLAADRNSLLLHVARVPQAFQLYVESESLHAKEAYAQEISRLEAAVRIEPLFALAHSRLAGLYSDLGWTVPALQHASAAKVLASGLPRKEELRLLATYHMLRSDYRRALQEYAEMARLYTRSWEAYQGLGDALLSSGETGKATACYKKAISLDPSQLEPYLRLCLAELRSGKYDEARLAWQQASSLASASTEVILAGGLVDLAESDLGSAIRAFRRLAGNADPVVRSRGIYLVGQTEIYGGRIHSALLTLESGSDEDRRQGHPALEADKRLARAQIFLLQGDAAAAASECRRVASLQGDAVRMASMGMILARAGRTNEATAIAVQVEQTPDCVTRQLHADVLRGEIALASGRTDEALAALRRAQKPGAIGQVLLARALAGARRWQQAEAEYRRLSEKKAEILFPHESPWFTATWGQVLFEYAKCLARLGKDAEARQQFRGYLWTMDEADPEIGSLQEARAVLKRKIQPRRELP